METLTLTPSCVKCGPHTLTTKTWYIWPWEGFGVQINKDKVYVWLSYV